MALFDPLQLVEIRTISKEEQSIHGVTKTVHVVVKSSPFHVVLEAPNYPINFSAMAFKGTLVYDCEEFKPVPSEEIPLVYTYRPFCNNTKLELEFKIKVLTSHREHKLFKIRIQAIDPSTKKDIRDCLIVTPPIKVLSKPLKQTGPATKKRAVPDKMADYIPRLEDQLQKQARLLEGISQRLPHKEIPDVPFEESFKSTLATFRLLSPDRKARIVRDGANRAALEEMFDLLSGEGSLGAHCNTAPLEIGCCPNSCPSKLELDRIEPHYLFLLGNSNPSPLFGTGYGSALEYSESVPSPSAFMLSEGLDT